VPARDGNGLNDLAHLAPMVVISFTPQMLL
jgi:hypothetical protein